jgi:RNA polymerase sigma-54 factor
MLIGSIDLRGYLQDYSEVSSSIMKELNVTQNNIDDALELIQTFEPDGMGARDLKECLLLQIRAHNFDNEGLEDVLLKAVDGHLDDLAEKRYDKIAKALGITRAGAEKLSEFIRNNLNPTPGSQYSEEVICAIPSFMIKKENDKYKAVNLEKNYGPVIKLNPTYEKMLRDPKTDAKTIEFLKERLHAAKNFMEHVAKRHETIEKIIDLIVNTQTGFFDGGPINLNPLMQKNIAEEFGLHPSTISRAVSNKYVQTPKGLVLLKKLCPREVKGQTREKIKKMVDDIVKKEDKNSPLNDDDIARMLGASGVHLERRTIANYRKKLGHEISSKRVKFPGKHDDR